MNLMKCFCLILSSSICAVACICAHGYIALCPVSHKCHTGSSSFIVYLRSSVVPVCFCFIVFIFFKFKWLFKEMKLHCVIFVYWCTVGLWNAIFLFVFNHFFYKVYVDLGLVSDFTHQFIVLFCVEFKALKEI